MGGPTVHDTRPNDLDKKIWKLLDKKINNHLTKRGRKIMEVITVNGKTYYSEPQTKQHEGDIKIVVLQRGWVLIGIFEKATEALCYLHNASVIRNWGTTNGLGELAHEGPRKDTKLDPCYGLVEFDILTMVLSIAVNKEVWQSKL